MEFWSDVERLAEGWTCAVPRDSSGSLGIPVTSLSPEGVVKFLTPLTVVSVVRC